MNISLSHLLRHRLGGRGGGLLLGGPGLLGLVAVEGAEGGSAARGPQHLAAVATLGVDPGEHDGGVGHLSADCCWSLHKDTAGCVLGWGVGGGHS